MKPERSNQPFSPKKGKSLSTVCADQRQMCCEEDNKDSSNRCPEDEAVTVSVLCRETGASGRSFSEGLLIIIAWVELNRNS